MPPIHERFRCADNPAMRVPQYVQLPEHETAICSECGAVTVLLGGRKLEPLWRNTQTGKVTCDDCYKERRST
jgi:hypothetical protein